MEFRIEARSKKILRKLDLHPEKARKGSLKGFFYAGKKLQKITQEKIKDKTTKTGRTYIFRGRTHKASASGEYPANRSGNLRKNIGFDVLTSEDMLFGTRKGALYGRFLEVGTNKLRPRPYLTRTVNANKLEVLNIIGREIDKEITR